MNKKGLFAVALSVCTRVACAAETEPIIPGSLEDLARFRKPPVENKMVADGFLWVEAEDFSDYGEWRLDTQFVHKMGSAYLLAGGVCKPIKEATTEVQVPQAGTYRVWVRTRNWLKDFAPGKFTVAVDGRRAEKVLGAGKPEVWAWESAGDFALAKGPVKLALMDLSGAFARCDALLLTRDLSYVPPEDLESVQRERARLTGTPQEVTDAGDFDVVVVGAGSTGCGAAVAAARTGAKTALVHDRPVLGGNASTELGVPTCGAARHDNAREGGLNEEANLVRAKNGFPKMSEAYAIQAAGEKNLTVFNNSRVVGVEMAGQSIRSVKAVNTLTLAPSRVRGKLFIDCTGDGWVGYYAGAISRFGRESRDEFGETAAPPKEDRITMSGCIMGNLALAYRAENTGHPVDYAPPAWAVKLPPPEEFHRTTKGVGGQWWLEHPGDFDDLEEPERARDELIRISFAYWGWVKNAWAEKDKARNFEMTYVPHIDARRETRRLVGDYILKQQDAEAGTMFPDRISYGGWSLDVHNPKGILSGKEGPYYFDGFVPIYSIPYRTIYSTNVPNLFFAGRCMSVTHIALGTVRVEATLSTVGQAAGTAAALCAKYGVSPRELGQRYIKDLQQRLLKDDQYIPELANEDSDDLARTAKVAASSTRSYTEYSKGSYKTDEEHPLNMPRAVLFPRGLTERLGKVNLCLISEAKEPVELTLHVRGAKAAGDFSSETDLATATAMVPAGRRAYVSFKLDCPLTDPYVWLWLPKTPGVSWVQMEGAMPEGCRAYGGGKGKPWTVVKGHQYAFYAEPALKFQTDNRPENVIDGVSRIVGKQSHVWASDPKQPFPQWIELDFGKAVEVNSVRLTFDSDFALTFPERPVPRQLVKDYRVESFDGAAWKEVASVKDNFLRLRVHNFPTRKASKMRLLVDATNGDPSARVFEIRAYREPDAK
jgi:hypothetical protein